MWSDRVSNLGPLALESDALSTDCAKQPGNIIQTAKQSPRTHTDSRCACEQQRERERERESRHYGGRIGRL